MKWAVKVYGERNSGTNYLEQLIEQNLNVHVLRIQEKPLHIFLLKLIRFDLIFDLVVYLQRKQILGWKHGCPKAKEIIAYQKSNLAIVTITKNPYAYLLSLHRNPYHFKGRVEAKFTDFLRQNWVTRVRDRVGKRKLDSPIELWNIKNRSYLNLKDQVPNRVFNLSYEALIENPEKAIRNLADALGLKLKREGTFYNIEQSTKDDAQSFEEYREYYLGGKYRQQLCAESIELINKGLDSSVVAYFQYTLLTSDTKAEDH